MNRPWAERHLHLIGIGGAGMSGLATACLSLGATVTGSDRARSSYTARLEGLGATVTIGHEAAHLPEAAEVVVSTAIADDNPELLLARERGQTISHRGELLAELCAEKRLIAVAGTHGKTTTTAMIAWALRRLGEDPAFFVGGEVPLDGGAVNAAWGEGEWVVAEADESDGSFLALRPEVAVVTNIELDHHSRWAGLAELKEAFAHFIAPAQVAVLGPDAEPATAQATGGDTATGRATPPETISFDERGPGPLNLDLSVPGRHNQLNARAALAALSEAGFAAQAVAEALATFPGVRRRLEFKGTLCGARIYDDYAHHPTEVRAALEALRGLGPRRLYAIFQPHLYSRTLALADGFGAALALADEVGVLEIYPAREEPVGRLAGVSGLSVAAAAADRAGGRPVWWLANADKAAAAFSERLVDGDILVTLGAGDITKLSERLAAG